MQIKRKGQHRGHVCPTERTRVVSKGKFGLVYLFFLLDVHDSIPGAFISYLSSTHFFILSSQWQ